MKRIFLIAFLIITITACTSAREVPQLTSTPISPSETPVPTQTPKPSSTPTPEPYLLDNGVLLDWDESEGDYVIATEGIDALTTSADGSIEARDDSDSPRFVFVEGVWMEILIPEGAENHEELVVQDRWVVQVVNGEVKRVKESGLRVLMDENGKFSHEWDEETRTWKVYNSRTFLFGFEADDLYSVLENGDVPSRVIESAEDIVTNMDKSKLFTRDGELVALGYDEGWGIEESFDGSRDIWWFGVNLGVGEYNYPDDNFKGDMIYIGTISLSGDVYVVGVSQWTETYSDVDISPAIMSYDDGQLPDKFVRGDSVSITIGKFVESMASKEAVGEVVHICSNLYINISNPIIDDHNRMLGDFMILMANDSKKQLSKDGYVYVNLNNMAMKNEVWAKLGY